MYTHHGHAVGRKFTRAYSIWANMKARCKPNYSKAHRYHGRGITVCPEWMEFPNFLGDMGVPPEGMSLDRIDNDKGYNKENCRWASPYQQSHNSSVIKIPFEVGVSMVVDYLHGYRRDELTNAYGIPWRYAWKILNEGLQPKVKITAKARYRRIFLMSAEEEVISRERILSALDRAVNKIIQEFIPMGFKNKAMARKPEMLAILMDELGQS